MKNKIKELRQRLGMTQEALAYQCGVVRQTINCVENDKYDPTLDLAFKIAQNLQVKVDELFIYE
ncbi:helix-turn-helix transcriptional regulator [Bacillus sp. FJAT-49736]|uniref:helix-turn-helix transcriptional regulator n=1 Tax=Bacillus sp. FJAT-49736 TaxID=2833582 RepID=UPI001BC9AB21|nr:helix-turn-helix transcriptional regulator [Bacillus sp. FJAT-49736]MBS4172342.1 helix-turn-helix transcriptional regulator [Bacillus sp. FJAT-49736]